MRRKIVQSRRNWHLALHTTQRCTKDDDEEEEDKEEDEDEKDEDEEDEDEEND